MGELGEGQVTPISLSSLAASSRFARHPSSDLPSASLRLGHLLPQGEKGTCFILATLPVGPGH